MMAGVTLCGAVEYTYGCRSLRELLHILFGCFVVRSCLTTGPDVFEVGIMHWFSIPTPEYCPMYL